MAVCASTAVCLYGCAAVRLCAPVRLCRGDVDGLVDEAQAGGALPDGVHGLQVHLADLVGLEGAGRGDEVEVEEWKEG